MRDEVRGSSEYMMTGQERYLQMKVTHRSNQYSLIMLQSSTPRPFISLITSMVSQARRVTVREDAGGPGNTRLPSATHPSNVLQWDEKGNKEEPVRVNIWLHIENSLLRWLTSVENSQSFHFHFPSANLWLAFKQSSQFPEEGWHLHCRSLSAATLCVRLMSDSEFPFVGFFPPLVSWKGDCKDCERNSKIMERHSMLSAVAFWFLLSTLWVSSHWNGLILEDVKWG